MKYEVGRRLTGVINNITDLGIFVTLPGRHYGLIHHSNFGNNWLRVRNQHQVGEKIRVVIIHNYRGRLGLSLSRLNDPKLVDPTNQFRKTPAQDFEQVLGQTVQDAKTEIKQLRKILTKN